MSHMIRPSRPIYRRRGHRGQTLIVAIAVIFILLFVGSVFVAQIARNLIAAGRSRDTADAQALAEAAVRYADTQLTSSPEGADWRPAPSPPLTAANDLQGTTDPDYYWLAGLDANNQPRGFSRITMAGGRALVRVSYEPHPSDPRSQLLKIEAVGRPGDLAGGSDPTVFVQEGNAPQLRRELIAYKQIGITDYLRFITKKDNTAATSYLGMPAIGVQATAVYGDPSIAATLGTGNDGLGGNNFSDYMIGAGIRSNMSIVIGGDTFFYASPARPFEGIQVDGKISTSPTNATGTPQTYENQVIGPTVPNYDPANAIRNSDDPTRTTNNGTVRDGSSSSDSQGYNNGIPRLDPPVIETPTPGDSVLRYRALTRDSGRWSVVNGRRFNSGQNGWGTGIYVNNPGDLQRETSSRSVNGSYSLRADWLNPNNQFSLSYWQGPFYRPPGVLVELLGDRIRLTRSDDGVFTRPDGTPITTQGGKVMDIPLRDADRTSYTFPDGSVFALPTYPHDGDEPGATSPFGDKQSYGVNVVIMAEGNIRVKGAYGAVTTPTLPGLRVHLTIVSGGTAYIEGNVVKGDGYLSGGNQQLEHASTCSILAKDYVTVNTTMFMSPQNQTNVWTRETPDMDAFHMELGQTRPTFDMSWSFGVPPSTYTYANGGRSQFLLLRHSALYPGPTYLNLLINPGAIGSNPLYPFDMQGFKINGGQFPPVETWMLGSKYVQAGTAFVQIEDDAARTMKFERRAFSLMGDPLLYQFNAISTPGVDNLLRFQVDNTITATALSQGLSLDSPTDYVLGGAMVAPLDIRIEALLYAQDHSFFIIPGYPLNPDPSDTRQNFAASGRRASYSLVWNQLGTQVVATLDTPGEMAAKDVFPFYNEPVDVRITIFGAVSENYTASEGDQKAWMTLWGWMPETHGSTNILSPATGDPVVLANRNTAAIPVPDDHRLVHDPIVNGFAYNPAEDRTKDFRTAQEASAGITRGLRFVYDPALSMPYLHPTGVDLDTGGTPTRLTRALRRKVWAAQLNPNDNTTQIMPSVMQVLPPTPRLPVCPGLLYFGDSDRKIGT